MSTAQAPPPAVPDDDTPGLSAVPPSPAKRPRPARKGGTARMRSAADADAGSNPELHIRSYADMAHWLQDTLGTGRLSGTFARSGELVYVPSVGESGYIPPVGNRDDNGGPSQVRRITPETLAAQIQYAYHCYRMTENDSGEKRKVRDLFPLVSAKYACNAPDQHPHIRPLGGVIHTPVFRADGTILSEPGYDAASSLLYLPLGGLRVPRVPSAPTRGQITAARNLLLEMVAGFQFKTDHDRANYIGVLLTPLLREMCPPPYKMVAVSAPQPGSGKTLLVTCSRCLHGGVFRSEIPDKSEELRKAITTILVETTGPIIQLDNVTGVLRSPILAGLFTSPDWSDRRLGSNEQIQRPNDRLWVVTANNLSIGGDLLRRTMWVTIDPMVPDPHLRTEFAIPDLERWVTDRRGELLAALLTLGAAWVAAGKPKTEIRGADSYRHWTQTVAGILAAGGVPGTFDHVDAARQVVGVDDAEWRDFLTAVHGEFGNRPWTVKELLGKIAVPSGPPGDFQVQEEIRQAANGQTIPLDALPTDLAEKASRSHVGVSAITKSLGKWIANRDGRYAGGMVVRSAGKDSHSKTGLWRVESVGVNSPAGSGDELAARRPVATTAPVEPEPAPASAPEPVTADPGGPCSTCAHPGPSCGMGGAAHDQLPCIRCDNPTAARSRCGAARHYDCRPPPVEQADPAEPVGPPVKAPF